MSPVTKRASRAAPRAAAKPLAEKLGKPLAAKAAGPSAPRLGIRSRKSTESDIQVSLKLDGSGKADVTTGIPFLDHMLELVAVHGLLDLRVRATGDLQVDQHHTVEDLGLVLGRALDAALGERKGIIRYASLTLPMDECLVNVAIDLGGRSHFAYDLRPKQRIVGAFDTTLFPHFLESLCATGRLTLHVTQLRGGNAHHLLEGCAKALGRTIDAAARRDPRRSGVPSSKGRID